SLLEIEQYEEGANDESSSAVFNFTQGALRTISGRIGSGLDDDYRLETTAATIGIRGTDYGLQYTDSEDEDGLYGRVNEGAITITNDAGTLEIGQNQFFFASDPDTPPIQITTPPANVLDGNDDGNTGDEETEESEETEEQQGNVQSPPAEVDEDDDFEVAGLTTGFVSGEDDPEPVSTDDVETDDPEPELAPLVDSVMAGAYGYSGTFFGGLIRDGDEYEGSFTVEEGESFRADFSGPALFESIEDASPYEEDAWISDDGAVAVYWGRWGSGTGNDPEGGSIDYTYDPGFVFMFSENVTTPTQLQALTGNMTYQYPKGPSNHLDQVSVISSTGNTNFVVDTMQLEVDFDSIAAAQFDMTIVDSDGISLIAAGSDGYQEILAGALELGLRGTWSHEDKDGLVEGTVSGQFVGSNAEGAIVYFELDAIEWQKLYGTTLLTQ
ncbi:MAG: hypothetical protein WED11_05105, partial [Natronospirillum sp.]